MRIQRFWLRVRRMRKAYIRVMMPTWSSCEKQVYAIYEKDQEAARAAAAKAQDEKFAALEGLLEGGKTTKASPKNKPTGSEKDRFSSKDSSKKRIRTMPVLSRGQGSMTAVADDSEEHLQQISVVDVDLVVFSKGLLVTPIEDPSGFSL
eukprot:symbB.v1.2.028544.t1/scaffold3031.1/size66479/1